MSDDRKEEEGTPAPLVDPKQDPEGEPVNQAEANPHFIGHYTPPQLTPVFSGIPTSYDPPSFPKPPPLTQPLYHYTDQLGLLGIVKNEELWATKINYMNDSTEFSAIFNLVAERLKNEEHNTPNISSTFPIPSHSEMLQSFAEGSKSVNICVVSFCKNGDLLSQWRGYAGGDYGYSIGFNADKLTDFAAKSNFVLRPCVYCKELQTRIVDEICTYYLTSTMPNALAVMSQFTATVISCGAFFKDQSFSEEDEWRLVSQPLADQELHFRKGKSMIIPYCKKIEFHGSSDTPIDDVVVGPCPHMNLSVEAVTTLFLHRKQPKVCPSVIPYVDW